MKRTKTISIVLVIIAIAIAAITTVFFVVKPGKKISQDGGVEIRPERKTYVKQVELQFGAVTTPLPTASISTTQSITPTGSDDTRSVVVTPPGQELLTPTIAAQITTTATISAVTNTPPTATLTKTSSGLPKAGFMQATVLAIGAGLLFLLFALVL